MKTILYYIVFLIPVAGFAQDAGWTIEAKTIDPNNYYGVTVANGMVGIVSSPEPMKVKDVVLNGVYDYYQRGRVSNILKTFNHITQQTLCRGLSVLVNHLFFQFLLRVCQATFQAPYLRLA